jgi:hypothetical protein
MKGAIRTSIGFMPFLRERVHFMAVPEWALILILLLNCSGTETDRHEKAGRPPGIHPDYASTVIPPNIAPLNFLIEESGERFRIRMHSASGSPVLINSRSASIRIPFKPWKTMLAANRGRDLAFDVSVRKDGSWRDFEPFRLHIAGEKIDGWLVYRLIRPVFNLWRDMGIYQRNLETFEEKAVIRNATLSNCINCHSFCNHSPSRWSLQMRYSPGGLLICRGDSAVNVNGLTRINPFPPAYTAWHPGGKTIAFSTGKVAQFFHAKGENRDVIDLSSDLILYDIESDSMITSSKIASPDRMETLPDWSPDGKTLFFCSAPALDSTFSVKDDYSGIRYDIMRAAYDISKHAFGDPDTVLSSAKTGKSLSHPKVSPDGRFLLFSMARYGYFTIYRQDSDLGMLDMKTGEILPLPVNSAFSESYHSWSSEGRWFVFSSKREDGICARPYFAYVDANGRACKPFLLPQENATYYDDYWITCNVPELISGPVRTAERTLIHAAEGLDEIIDAKPLSGRRGGRSRVPDGPDSTDAREWQEKL